MQIESVPPKVFFLPYATEEMVEEVANRCGGFPCYTSNGLKAIFTPEQFKSAIKDLRRQYAP